MSLFITLHRKLNLNTLPSLQFFYIGYNPRDIRLISKKYFVILAVFTILVTPAYADPIVKTTSAGTINVGFTTDPVAPNPGDPTQIKISFINKQTNQIQPHIDYKISVMQDGNAVFGIPITHTAEGAVSIPFTFQTAGTYQVIVDVEGILFQPIPPETATFDLNVGSSSSTNSTASSTNSTMSDNNTNNAIPEFPVSSLMVMAIVVGVAILFVRMHPSLTNIRL